MVQLILVVDRLFFVYSLILLARVLMSWLPGLDPRNPIVQFLVQVTEPVLAPLRRLIPPVAMMDISPIVAFLLIEVVRRLVVGALMATAPGF
jgi:YggT family protein